MAEALMDPIGASDMAVLTAGFALSLSSFLLVYLVLPQRMMQMAKREHEERVDEQWKGPVITVYRQPIRQQPPAKDLLSAHKHLPGPM